jgi:WD40 repeat protein/serine/threonine protein kinase
MAEAGFLSARCPACGASSAHVPARLAGRTVRCPRCSARFVVAAAPPPRPEPAPTIAGEAAPAPTVAADAVPPPTVADDAAPAPTVAEEAGPAPTVADEAAPAPTVAEDAAPAPTLPEPDALAPTLAESGTPTGAGWRPGDVVLGLYEVAGVLGEGGMGRVYRVRHRGWDLDLAVKVPLASVLEARGGADLFEREAETWVNLGLHPHVVTCHYVRRVDGLPLVFAEYADGGSLHDAIRGGRLTSVDGILDVAIQFAWGLHHAHEQGLVHRDVKPANVMLTSDGLAKVTDFGLARARPLRMKAPGGALAGHTMTFEGGAGGTPAYVSPEQAGGRPLNRRSDLWSFALSVLEAFIGGRAWEFGLAAPEVLAAVRGNPAEARTALPDSVADLLARCFQERPDDRPHDLAEVAAILRSAWEAAMGRSYPRQEPRGGIRSADALNNRAVSLVDLGRSADASALWQQALSAEAQHVEATYNAGLAAWLDARVTDDELLRRMAEACTSHATRGRARQLLGRVHLVLEQRPEALAAFERAGALGGADDLDRELAHAPAAPEPPLRTLRGLPGPIAALALSADGHTVAAGSGAEVRLWDAGSGEHLRTLPIAGAKVRTLALLPDQRFLLVGVENARLAQWDLASGRPVRVWAHHSGFATSLAVVSDGGLVVSGGSDRLVRLWDPATGRPVREMAGHEDAVTAVAAAKAHVASASRDGTVRIWAVEDGRCLGVLRGHEGRVLAVALDEPRSRVVSAGEDGTVRDWGLRSHETVRVYRSHAQPVTGVALSADGARILSGSGDRTVRAFLTDGERLASLVRLAAGVQALAIAPDGTAWAAYGTTVSALASSRLQVPAPALCRPTSAAEVEDRASAAQAGLEEARRLLASGDVVTAVSLARRARSVPGHERSEAALAVWDDLCARLPRRALQSAWEAARLEGHEDQVLGVAVGPAGARALTAGLDATVRIWDLAARRAEAVLAGHEGAVTAVAFAGPARALSAGRDRSVRVWDLAARQELAVLEDHADTVMSVDATADGARAASAAADGTVRLWDLRRGESVRVLEGHGAPVAAVCLSPDGQVVASGGWDGTARLWDAESGSALGVLEGHDANVTAVALHANGRLATGGADGAIRLWDARTRRAERVLSGHEGEVTGLVFTPDGRFLVSASRDRSARVWDLRRAAAVRTLAHPELVLGAALTPVATLLLTAGADRCARLWHLDWEPETSAAATVVPTIVPSAQATVRTRVARAFPPAHATTLRDDLRKAAPAAPAVLPRIARLPWRWFAVGLAVLGSIGVASLTLRQAPVVALSPYMAQEVPRELDLIPLEPFTNDCSPDDYERHLEAVRAGNPGARDVACVAARGTPGVVADVLDGAPLDAPEPLTERRLRRNAASALAGLRGDAVTAVCQRLGDERESARDVAAMALSLLDDPAAGTCVRDALAGGGVAASSAARALRQRVARGLVPVGDAWALTTAALASGDPDTRKGGLLLARVFSGAVAGPAVRPLLDDPDPEVAAAAREADASIRRVLQTDRLRGNAR